jgi:hypothetical protein
VYIYKAIQVFSQTAVVRHPIEHSTHKQASMTLPTLPYAIFSTFARHTKPTHKSQPCKRAKKANARPHPPWLTNIYQHLFYTSTVALNSTDTNNYDIQIHIK